jgi:hypothetical protein
MGVLLWFLIGPDVRFGAGYLWSLALLITSAGIPAFAKVRTLMVLVLLLCLVSFVPRAHALYFGLPPIRKIFRNPNEFLTELPIRDAITKIVKTSNGVTVYVPDDRTFDCWLSKLPCTPHVYKNLIAERNPDGSFKMFYIRRNDP